MINPLIITPEAEKDIRDAYSWYESQMIGLGAEFIRCLEAGFAFISRTPEVQGKIYKDIRRILIRRFPYGIFFVFRNNQIVILAVMHAKRHPRGWQNRW